MLSLVMNTRKITSVGQRKTSTAPMSHLMNTKRVNERNGYMNAMAICPACRQPIGVRKVTGLNPHFFFFVPRSRHDEQYMFVINIIMEQLSTHNIQSCRICILCVDNCPMMIFMTNMYCSSCRIIMYIVCRQLSHDDIYDKHVLFIMSHMYIVCGQLSHDDIYDKHVLFIMSHMYIVCRQLSHDDIYDKHVLFIMSHNYVYCV